MYTHKMFEVEVCLMNETYTFNDNKFSNLKSKYEEPYYNHCILNYSLSHKTNPLKTFIWPVS